MKYYKVLKNDGSCANGGSGKWHLPKKLKDGTWKPGKWMPKIDGELEPCKNGYHICRKKDLVHWLDDAIFEVEYRGEIIEDDDKCVVREARLLCRVETWNVKTARLFAADCAEHVLPIFEKKYPEDDRPRKAIQAARDYENGLIDKNELAAAGCAAAYAANAAGYVANAAGYAAAYAANAAAYAAAAGAAAYAADSAYAVAYGAGYVANAAGDAAGDAAGNAAAAAGAAARAAERKWQTEKLFEYLEAK